MRLLVTVTLACAAMTACIVVKAPVDPCLVNGKNPCDAADKNVCVVEDGNPRCLCNAGFLARPSGACEAIGAGNCPEHTGDSAEPDDCLTRARPMLPTDSPRSQTIEPVGDYDFISFQATAKHVYVVTAKAAGALYPRIDAYDQGGQWLALDERPGSAQLAMKAPATAPVYVRVSHSPLDPSVASGSYTLTLATSGLEDHGDTPADATNVVADPGTSPTPITGRFEVPRDQDWFSFAGTTNMYFRVTFDTSKGPAPLMSLFTASDTTRPKWTAQQPVTDFDLTANETAYLALYASGEPASYAFTLTRSAK
jgi:hypothetical protein